MESCTFTGTNSEIPDYSLGSEKQIVGEVSIVKKKQPRTERIDVRNWRIGIGGSKSGVIKSYETGVNGAKITSLSEIDLQQNPVVFKMWKHQGMRKQVSCEGLCSEGEVNAEGSFAVKHQISAQLTGKFFYGPMVLMPYGKLYPHFQRRLKSCFELTLSPSCNGTLGMIYLVKSTVTQGNALGQPTRAIIDTEGEYVLYTPDKAATSPVLNQVKVKNGLLMQEHEFLKPNQYEPEIKVKQLVKQSNRYQFEEAYQSYLVFKGDSPNDIWYPVAYSDLDAGQPICTHTKFWSAIQYNSENKIWDFEGYRHVDPTVEAIDSLPVWNRHIHNCKSSIADLVQQIKHEILNVANAENVEELMGILGLADKAPEHLLSLQEKIKLVNTFVQSTFGGYVDFPNKYEFANIKKTTKDPKIFDATYGLDGGWRKLWEVTINNDKAKACTSNTFPPKAHAGQLDNCNPEYANIIGGHVTDGRHATQLPQGDPDAYILPICKKHNSKNSIWMECRKYRRGVLLANFMT